MRILIVRLGALGDIVHAVPALAALRRAHPEARIDWLVEARHRAVLDLVRGVDERIVIDTRGRWARLPAVIRRLRAPGYDAALDLQGLFKSAVLARLSGALRVLGFERAALREGIAAPLYTERHAVDDRGHVVRKNLALAAALGAATDRIEFPIEVPPTPIAVEQPYALVNPGAGWPNKQWPAERFAALARWLRDAHGLRSLVLWGPQEQGLAAGIVAASTEAATLAPTTSIGDVLALARGARLVVSGDTGPLHLAVAVGAPVVGLFGPTSPARNGPVRPDDEAVSRFDACVCHHERRCRRASACIDAIALDEVQAAVARRLSITSGKQ